MFVKISVFARLCFLFLCVSVRSAFALPPSLLPDPGPVQIYPSFPNFNACATWFKDRSTGDECLRRVYDPIIHNAYEYWCGRPLQEEQCELSYPQGILNVCCPQFKDGENRDAQCNKSAACQTQASEEVLRCERDLCQLIHRGAISNSLTWEYKNSCLALEQSEYADCMQSNATTEAITGVTTNAVTEE